MCNINERTDFVDNRGPNKKLNEHELKIWPEFFNAVLDGSKKFEIRKNDRNFKVGDKIVLKEWDPKKESYTGRSLAKWISFIVPGGNFGLEKDFCVMSIKSFKKCVIKGGEQDSKCEFWEPSNTNCANREKCVFQKKEISSRETSREAMVSRNTTEKNKGEIDKPEKMTKIEIISLSLFSILFLAFNLIYGLLSASSIPFILPLHIVIGVLFLLIEGVLLLIYFRVPIRKKRRS